MPNRSTAIIYSSLRTTDEGAHMPGTMLRFQHIWLGYTQLPSLLYTGKTKPDSQTLLVTDPFSHICDTSSLALHKI